MATAKPLDIIARFRTVTTDFKTDQVTRELADSEQAFKDSADASKQWSRDITTNADHAGSDLSNRFTRSIEHEGKRGVKKIGKEIGGELTQNIGEGVSSGAANMTDVVAGTIGGILPALGIGGAAVGVGVSMVVGVISGIRKRRAEAIAAAKTFGSDVAAAMADGVISQAEKQNIAQEALGVNNWQDAAAKIVKQAKVIGVLPDVLTNALAGMPAAQDEVGKAIDKVNASLATQVQTNESARGAYGRLLPAAQAVKDQVDGISHALGKSNDAWGRGTQAQINHELALRATKDQAIDTARGLDKATIAAGKLAAQSPVNLEIHAETFAANQEINRFISRSEAKTIRLHVDPVVTDATLRGIINKINAGLGAAVNGRPPA
jgi:hypothetical protein